MQCNKNQLSALEQLNITETAIYLSMFITQGCFSMCIQTNNSIAKISGASVKTVMRYKPILEGKGFIKRAGYIHDSSGSIINSIIWVNNFEVVPSQFQQMPIGFESDLSGLISYYEMNPDGERVVRL